MCIFLNAIDHVGSTRIFARLAGDRQLVIYEMDLSSSQDTAMLLPVPVAQGGDSAVQWMDLSSYPDIFADIDKCFPACRAAPVSNATPSALAVTTVGAYEASFVPALEDFSRLDARFLLNASLFEHVPIYQSFGFAVFQLRAGSNRIHPMAFSFKTAEPFSLFYPTVHMHDGQWHPNAAFDHCLYAQGRLRPHPRLTPAADLPDKHLQWSRDKVTHWIEPKQPLFKLPLHGSFSNTDIRLKLK